jgi:peptidoglycan hydrolase-like protein with peptidoglycan-binding domain
VAIVIATTAACGVIALTSRGSNDNANAAGYAETPAALAGDVRIALTSPDDDAADTTLVDAAASVPAATNTSVPDADVGTDVQDLDGAPNTGEGCTMSAQSIRVGSTGDSVTCLQGALAAAGYYSGPINGSYDQATYAAVEELQTDRKLFVDGIAGRESGLSLGIWPDEASSVIRTPPPEPGAVDLMGYPLSSVSSFGSNAPPLPANSGSGRRVVYDRLGQRVWAVDDDGTIIRSWLVSGSQYSNEVPGTWEVYSRSNPSTAWNGKALLPKMVRYYKTQIGAIGFHAIPLHIADNSPYQTEAELGTRLSGGCQRQANRDADFMWDFAQVGTPVVVI